MAVALDNALSGLRVAQQSLNVLSMNIANANNPNYTRQTVSQEAVSVGGEIGNGVDISSIDRQINQYITQSVVTSSSSVAQSKAVNKYYQQLQVFIGQPGKNNSIDTYVNNFFNSISQLSVNPETSSLKTNALAAGNNLATQISGLAKNVEDLRYYADSEIKTSVNTINDNLKNIFKLNNAILNAKTNNQSVNTLEDSIEVSIKELATLVNIRYRTEQDGTISVTTSNGLLLTGNGNLSELDYTAASSADDFKNNIASSPINVYQLDNLGKRQGSPVPLVSGGLEDQVTTVISSGKLMGLLQVRDKTMPDVLKQLDNLAYQVVNSVNAIHNEGSGFPPVQSLTGTTMIEPNVPRQWSGSVMIAALDGDGNAISSPYASDRLNNNGYAPLTIDLASMNSGSGKGKVTMQSVIDQINHYYGAPQPRASIGNLSNIELVANSDSLTAGSGTFNFSLDLSSLSANNTSFQVTGAAISGGATINTPPSSVTVNGGSTVDTAGTIDFTANLAASGPGPFTVTLNVQTTDANGAVTSGVVTYTLTAAASGLRNNNYSPVTATGGAALEAPSFSTPILTAKLVDANGNEVAKNPITGKYTTSGYLQISGTNSSYRVALSELDSKELGDARFQPSANPTNYGFSHYLGLNNFFTDNGQKTGSAINMSISKSIGDNPQLIALGKLTLSTQPTDTTKKRYTYEVGSGSNQTVDALSTLGTNPLRYLAAGGLSETKLTFSDYAAQILGDAAAKTVSSDNDLTQQQLINQGFVDKDRSIRGVNIDEEMANTILFQNAYSANARVITVTKQLFEELIAVFN